MRTHSYLPHRRHECCDLSFTEGPRAALTRTFGQIVSSQLVVPFLLGGLAGLVAWRNICHLPFWVSGVIAPPHLLEIGFTRHRRTIVVVLFLQERVSRRKRNSSGKSPVAHLTLKLSRTLNFRHLCPAPAKATTASKCSCPSSVAQRALMDANFDMRERRCWPCCGYRLCFLKALRASLYLPASTRRAGLSSR